MKFTLTLGLSRRSRAWFMIALLGSWQVWQPIQAANIDWTANSSADLLWSNGLNWSVGVPTAADDVRFLTPIPNPGVLLNPQVITLGAGSLANSLSSDANYTLSGGDLTLTTGAIRADLGTSLTIGSQLLGTGGLTVTGGGFVHLTNATNSYTGVTTINNGALSISNEAALGTDTSAIVVNGSETRGFGGGSLVLGGGYASGVTLNRNLTLTGLGPISERSGALVSVGNNTVNGNITTIGAGLINTRILSAGGTLTINGGLDVPGVAATDFAILGGVNVAGIANFTLNGALTGTGTLEKNGGGTLILNPSSSAGFSGQIRATASGTTAAQSTIRILNNSSLGTRTGTAANGVIDLNGGIVEVLMDAPVLTPGGTAASVYQRANASTFFIDHAPGSSAINGTLLLNTYSMVATNVTGTFAGRNGYNVTFNGVASATTATNSQGISNNMSGTLTFANTGSFWNHTDTTVRTLTITGSGNTIVAGSVVATNADAGEDHVLTKAGAGTWSILGVASTLDGATNIQAGTLGITDFRSLTNNTQAINIGATTVAGTLNIGTTTTPTAAGLTTSKVINLAGTTGGATINANQLGANPVVFNAAFTATGAGVKTLTLGGTNVANNAVNGAIVENAGALALVKTDAGTWVLGGNNVYTGGTTISGGTLKIKASVAASNIINSTAAVTFGANAATGSAGGTLEMLGIGANTSESLGALTPTAGMSTIRLTPSGAFGSSLVFSSLGTVNQAAGVNVVTSNALSTVTLTGAGTSTATTLPGNGKIYINGANFARLATNVLVTPVYGTDAGFVNAGAALTAANHNRMAANITGQAAVTVSSLKLDGNRTLDLAGIMTISTGGLLQAAATSGTISTTGAAGVTTGGANALAVRVDGTATDVLNLNVPITGGTGGLTKNGAGILVLGVAGQAQTGATTVNEGTLKLGTGANLSAAAQALVIRQAGKLDINGNNTGAAINAFDGSGIVTNSSATAGTLVVGGTNGAGTFAGVIENGTGVVNVTKTGTGAMTWSGVNTYTGATTIGSTGIVTVPLLANIGVPSGIGRGDAGNNAGSLVFDGTTSGISYTGVPSVSTDRNFTFAGVGVGAGAQLQANGSNNATLIWGGSTDTPAFIGNDAQTLTLAGSSTGDNTINLILADNANSAAATTIIKAGTGIWHLGNAANTYTGITTISAGQLGAVHGTSLPTNSPLVLSGGVLLSSGNFTRDTIAAAAAGTGTITWTGTTAAGFAANASKLTVNLNNGVALPVWGANGFVATGQPLLLSSANALSEVEVANGIDLNGALRTIQVDDNGNTATDFATITGALSNGAGTAAGVLKSGTGILQLLGQNTYDGTTEVTNGTLVVSSLGNSAVAGVPTSVGLSTSANQASHAVILGNATTTAGILQYVGPGETSDRNIQINGTTPTNQIHADGAGALILTNVTHNTVATGNKTLFLRGSSAAGNTISSVLANNGTGVLGVTVDGGATWILSGNNTYTGSTTIGAGALGIGSAAAAGTGTIIHTAGSVFAAGADRTVTNPYSTNNTTTAQNPAFIGDYSLTLGGLWTHTNTTVNNTITNTIVQGEALTIAGGLNFTGITAARTLTINGTGDTIISGNITTPTAFDVPLTHSGTGTLTLSGTASARNAGALTVSSGTLKIGANEVISHGGFGATTSATTVAMAATNTITVADTSLLTVGQIFTGTGVTAGSRVDSIIDGTNFTTAAPQTIASGVTLSFVATSGNVVINPAATITSTFDLNGFNETINGLTATSAGNTIIDNTGTTPSTLTFGDRNAAVAIGAGAGTFSITDSGPSTLSIAKIGTGAATITNTALTYTGTTSVSGGSLTIASPVNGTTALIATGTGTLAMTGGITAPGSITNVTVDAGATLSLLDGLGNQLNSLITLNLGAAGSGTATLNLNVGDLVTSGDGLSTDTLTLLTGGTFGMLPANTVTFNLTDIGLNGGTTYTLLNDMNGGFLSGGLAASNYILGGTPGGFSGMTLNVTNNLVTLTTGTLITGDSYFNGGGALPTWNDVANWATTKPGTIAAASIPGAGTKVVFRADNLTGNSPLSTTLEQNIRINNLKFEASTVAGDTPQAVLIASGAVSTNRLDISPQVSTDGIQITATGPTNVVISSQLRAGTAQTWDVANFSTVPLTGGVTVAGNPSVTVASTTGLSAGMQIVGPGIPTGATIVSVDSATTFTMSANATGANAALQTYSATSAMTLSGGLTGSGNITTSGIGRVVLSGSGSTYTGTAVNITGGTLEAQNVTALGGIAATPNTGAVITIGAGGQFRYNSATAGTIANSLVLNGGTLSTGGFTSNATTLALTAINHTFSGTVNAAANSTINLADLNGTSHTITMPGVISGSGAITVDSNTALSGGNQLNGTLQINGANTGWSGGLTMMRGTVATTNINGIGTGPITASGFGRINFQGPNATTWTLPNTVTFAPGAILEMGNDNVAGTPTAPFVTEFSGPVTLAAASGMRLFLTDGANSATNFTGGVSLTGDASISVGGAAGGVATIPSVISEIGGPRALAVNDDLGGWATTNRTLRLTGANTFTGGISVAEGVLEYSTVSNVGGPASNLGQGSTIGVGAGTLSFIGAASQSTNRPISTNAPGGTTTTPAVSTLAANGTGGASITYAGPITQISENSLTLVGVPGSEGIISGGITQIGTAADLNINSGTWTFSGAPSAIADDTVVTGPTAVLNLNATGVLTGLSGTSNGLYSRGGAMINLGANGAYGAGLDFILIGDNSVGGATLNTNTFSITTPRFDLGQSTTGFVGSVIGTGTINATTNHNLYRGTVSAGLAGAGAILKDFSGDVTLSGDNSGLTGTAAARIDAGNLFLDYTTSNTTKLNAAGALDMRGGNLILTGNDTAPTVQTVAGFTLANGGSNKITVNAGAGQNATLNLGAITRATNAGTIRFTAIAPSAVLTTTTGNGATTGILGGYATINDGTGTFFARNDGTGNIVAMASSAKDGVTTWLPNENVTDSAGYFGTVMGCANISSLRFDAAGPSTVTVDGSSLLNLGSGGILVTSNVVGGVPTITGGTLSSSTGEIVVTQDSTAQTMTIESRITGASSLTKTGAGTLRLNSTNNNSVGNVLVQNGTLLAAGGGAIGDSSVITLANDQASTFQLAANETIGALAGGNTTAQFAFGTVALGANTLTLRAPSSQTYAGFVTGSGGLVINSLGFNQQWQGASTGFSGPVIVNSGLFYLSNIGALNASSITINRTGNFLIDNNGTTRSGTRLPDTMPFNLNSADGTFSGETAIRGLATRSNQGNTLSETVGAVNVNSGASYATLEATVGSSITKILVDNVTRSNSATFNIRGTNLSATANQRSGLQITTTLNETAFVATLVGGAVTAGNDNIGIVPWAIGETFTGGVSATASMGNSLMTYVTGNGFRTLDFATEYATYNLGVAGDNIRESLTADLTGLTTKTINSLVIDNASAAASTIAVTGAGAGNTLTVTSGAMLFTLNPAAAASSAHVVNVSGFDGITTAGAVPEYVIHVVNPLSTATTPTLTASISSPLTSAANITKSGRGTLILSGLNTAGGGTKRTTLNEGVLEITDLDNIGGATGEINFAGGILRLSPTYSGDDLSTRTLNLLNSGGTIDTNGNNLTLASAIGNGSAGSFTKTGLGNLTLSAPVTYTGTTTVANGTLTAGVANVFPATGSVVINGATATLDVGAFNQTVGTLTITAGTLAGVATVTAADVQLQGGSVASTVVLAAPNGITKTTTGTTALAGLQPLIGQVVVQNGILSFDTIANTDGTVTAIGAPANAAAGTIKLGQGANTAGLTYTGTGASTNRNIELLASTGVMSLNNNGTGALVYNGIATAMEGGTKTFALGGTADPAIINRLTTAIVECVGSVNLAKQGISTWQLDVAQTYTGATQINEGILLSTLNNVLPVTTTVRMGNGTTAGTLDLNGFNQTIAGLTSTSNSTTATNNVIVDAGNTLTVNGPVTLGVNAAAATTLLNATGGGSLVVNNVGGTFQVGGGTGDTNVSTTTVDLSGLANVTIDLGPTGTLRVGDNNTNTSGSPIGSSTLTLGSAANVITAGTISLGQGTGQGDSVQTLALGAGTNVINANTINIGGNTSRSGGAIVFDDVSGSVTIRDAAGTGPAVINMVNGAINTGFNHTSQLLLAGHNADILASTITMAARSANTGSVVATATFDEGALTATTLVMASRTGAGTGSATATMTLGDSATLGSPTTAITTLTMAVNTSGGGTSTADLNVTGGIVNLGTVNMANATAGRTAVATIDLTGGTTTLAGNITRTGGAGTETATLTLAGGTLDMASNSIGSATANVALVAESGTLKNLANLNGSGTLTKTTTGNLILDGINPYTGNTAITAGSLQVDGTLGNGLGGSITTDVGAMLRGTGTISPATDKNITINGALVPGTVSGTTGSDLAIELLGTGTLALNGSVDFSLFSNAMTGTLNPATANTMVDVNAPNWTNITFGPSAVLNVTTPLSTTGWMGGDAWKIFDWVGVLAGSAPAIGSFPTINLPAIDPSLSWNTSNLFTTGVISIVGAVPEPSRVMLLMLGLLGLLARRRRLR